MTAKPPRLVKHYTSSVIIISDSSPLKTLLLHHRKYDKWMPPGGHQEEFENPVEAAIRETKEETGIDITDAMGATYPLDAGAIQVRRPDYFLEEQIPRYGKRDPHVHLDQIYVVHLPQQEATLNTDEAHDIAWFTLEETEKLPTFENIHLLLRQEMTV